MNSIYFFSFIILIKISKKMKLFKQIPTFIIVFGFLLIYAQSEYGLNGGVNFGVGIIGIGAILLGMEEILSRYGSYATSGQDSTQSEAFRGIVAIMSGLSFLIAGFGAIIYSAISFLGWNEAALGFIKNRPSSLLLFGGLFTAFFAFTLMIGSEEDKRSTAAVIKNIPKKLFGILLQAASGALLVLGAIEVISPVAFDGIIQQALNSIRPGF